MEEQSQTHTKVLLVPRYNYESRAWEESPEDIVCCFQQIITLIISTTSMSMTTSMTTSMSMTNEMTILLELSIQMIKYHSFNNNNIINNNIINSNNNSNNNLTVDFMIKSVFYEFGWKLLLFSFQKQSINNNNNINNRNFIKQLYYKISQNSFNLENINLNFNENSIKNIQTEIILWEYLIILTQICSIETIHAFLDDLLLLTSDGASMQEKQRMILLLNKIAMEWNYSIIKQNLVIIIIKWLIDR